MNCQTWQFYLKMLFSNDSQTISLRFICRIIEKRRDYLIVYISENALETSCYSIEADLIQLAERAHNTAVSSLSDPSLKILFRGWSFKHHSWGVSMHLIWKLLHSS